MNDKWFRIMVAVAVIGLVAGTWGMVERLLYGLNPVAFGSYIPWGLWVSFYLFFLGLSAGAFLVTIMVYVFNLKRFESIGRLSAFVVLIALLCEVLFITLDLGQMFRIYQFALTPSFSSLMTWMFVLFPLMLGIYAFKTFFLVREDLVLRAGNPEARGSRVCRLLTFGQTDCGEAKLERDRRWVHRLAVLSLPVGLMFYGINGAFFAILLGRPIWNSAMTPLLFILAALLSGGALIAFLTYVFKRDEELVCGLGRAVLGILLVFLFLEALQFFVGYQSGVVMVVSSLNLVTIGPYWWTFWIVHLLIGSLIPLYLLVRRHADARSVAAACFLIVVTFVAVRFNFIIPDLAVYKLEGLETTFYHARLRTDYVPNLNEWLVTIWVVSFGLLAFVLGTRYLPVVSPEKGREEHVEA